MLFPIRTIKEKALSLQCLKFNRFLDTSSYHSKIVIVEKCSEQAHGAGHDPN